MANQRTFNLLKPIELPPTIWDKVYNWILINARVVILITELLIVVAFLGKVIQDTEAKNKDKEITSAKSELAFYAPDREPMYRDIQQRASQYGLIWNNSSSYTNILKEVYSYISNPGTEISIRAEKTKLSVLGYVDLASLRQLETSMKASSTFSSVYVDTLTLDKKEVDQSKGKYVLIAQINNYKRDPI